MQAIELGKTQAALARGSTESILAPNTAKWGLE